ncbi:MAG TPA: response regulator [Thermoanaerobaculia bacterium]
MTAEGRVLVVDDEPAIRALVAKIVGRAGLPVDTACDGSDAIARMQETTYAVLVVDLMMPIVDGFGVVDYVRRMPPPRPSVIVASASDSAVLRQLDPTIVHSIIRKPFEIDVLGDLIVAAARTSIEAAASHSAAIINFPKTAR